MEFSESLAFIERGYEVKRNLAHGTPVVLTEEDKKKGVMEIKESNDRRKFGRESREFKKLDDVMLVHKTNYPPRKCTIETRVSAKVVEQETIFIFEGWYTVNSRPYRNTVHFAANHEVSGNSGGDWYSMKYAVITPLTSIPKERVKSNRSVDTFVEGSVSIGEGSYILCPKEEMAAIQEMNPGVTVVGYEGTCVLDYANILLWILDKPVVFGNDWGIASEQAESYQSVLTREGYTNFDAHYFSETEKVSNANKGMSLAVGILELIMNTPELCSIDDSYEIAEQGGLFDTLCYCDRATPGYLDKLLNEIGLKGRYEGPFASNEDFQDWCVSLIDEAKELAACKAAQK